MSFFLGKLLALAVAGGGGFTIYYLTKPSSTSQPKEIRAPDCRNPYELKLDDGGVTYYLNTKRKAEEYLREDLQGKTGKITLRENPECPDWASLEK